MRARRIVGLSVTITDTSSASGLGLTPMALQNAAGKFVPPTKESLEAAVPQMTKLPDGTLFPNPKATGDGTYVMPLVLYAVIPADDSAPRRANVVKFLDYALGDGQTKLPVGAYPLPTDVLAAAKKALHSAVSPSPTPKPSNPSNNSSSTPNSTSPTASPTPSPGAGAALAGRQQTRVGGQRTQRGERCDRHSAFRQPGGGRWLVGADRIGLAGCPVEQCPVHFLRASTSGSAADRFGRDGRKSGRCPATRPRPALIDRVAQ
ncbi:hypothetical protein [Fodinicola feengrottensis]|uniref:hypothetical protein n=1 Tax=Fodinicola feengrottensis TaxID=435914 RepID=UPI0013D33ED3|nr:hypothetical protein [Fodinicola feengrottensis]